MHVTRLPEEQFPQPDKALLERLPVEEIIEQVNAILRAHGLEPSSPTLVSCTSALRTAPAQSLRWWPVCKGSDGRCRASKWSVMIPVSNLAAHRKSHCIDERE